MRYLPVVHVLCVCVRLFYVGQSANILLQLCQVSGSLYVREYVCVLWAHVCGGRGITIWISLNTVRELE